MDKLFNIDYILKEDDAKILNPQILAFIGDSVYALYMKTYVIKNYTYTSNKLNTLTNNLVNASKQSKVLENIINNLTQDELAIYKRARNYKTNNTAKNANVIDYKRATGLEAVIGYLYLINNKERLNILLKNCLEESYED